MKAYTLKRRKDTEEYHLFEGLFANSSPNCSSDQLSICCKMIKIESVRIVFTCFNEDQARRQIAVIGRSVCGVCSSHLCET